MPRPTLAVPIPFVLLLSCTPGELPPPPVPRGDVAAVRALSAQPQALAALDPADSAWERAGGAALAAARPVTLPLREAVYLPPDQPAVLAWSFPLRRGQVLAIEAETMDEESVPVLELLQADGSGEYRRVAGGGRALSSLEFEVPQTGEYALRVRGEPGRGGRFVLSVRAPRALAFPVAGRDAGAIRGSFGDGRDGGRRDHDGIDIFAPRGTPVLAAASAVVSRVETDRTGGRVIWAWDEVRALSYFYAHLERQLVRRGAPIAAGDTIGTVGNSGNARGSSPHLHFGIYRPGTVPIDPAPFLAGAAGELPDSPRDSAVAGLGNWARTRTDAVRLRASPERNASIVSQLEQGTVVRLVGAVQEWRRVRLADGTAGFVANWLLEPLAGSY